MNTKAPEHIKHLLKLMVPAMVLALGAHCMKPAWAQFNNSPVTRQTTPAGQPAPLGKKPPVGSGNNPGLLTPGDDPMASQGPPSGVALSHPEFGTDFPHQYAQQQAIIYQLRNDAQQRGWRMVNTRRAPGAKTSTEVKVDDSVLEKQEEQDYPYPTASGKGPEIIHSYVLKDNSVIAEPLPTQQHIPVIDEISMTSLGQWQENWTVGRTVHTNTASWHRHELIEPCPTTLKFARWGVLLAVIFATVLMAFSAYSVVLGHKGGGHRVASTAAGLVLLLMGYTIYKIVMINAFRYPYEQNWDQIEMQQANNVGVNNKAANNTPVIVPPVIPRTPPRSPLPVLPFGAKNR